MAWRLVLPLLLAGHFAWASDTLPPLIDVAASPTLGEQIFVEREAGHCVLCHRVEGLDAPFQGNLGPALTGIGSLLSAAQIRLRVVDASRLNPDTIMPPYFRSEGLQQVASDYRGQTVLSAEQIEHLVAWLATLEQPDD